jgi:hypothetical protein
MWGTSSPEDKLTGDLGNVIEATSLGGRGSDFFTAGKLAPGHLGLLQQNLPAADICSAAKRHSLNDLVGKGEQLVAEDAQHVFDSDGGNRSRRLHCIASEITKSQNQMPEVLEPTTNGSGRYCRNRCV